jgi:integrase
MRSYLEFTQQLGINPTTPITEEVACLFATHLAANKHNRASTIRAYLNHVKSWHIDLGTYSKTEEFLRLDRLVEGIIRNQVARPTKRAAPLTTDILKRIAGSINQKDKNEVTWMAIASLATHGLFRLGELVPSKKGDQPTLDRDQIQLQQDHVAIKLTKEKTDQLGLSEPVLVARMVSTTCPWLWLHKMRALDQRTKPTGHAFQDALGQPVTKAWVVYRLRRKLSAMGLKPEKFTGHSFRRGGATSLALAGVPDNVIAAIGRWKSTSFQLYIDLPREAKFRAQRAMAEGTWVSGVPGRPRVSIRRPSGRGVMLEVGPN